MHSIKQPNNVVALHYNIDHGALLSEQEQIEALHQFINQHYSCKCSYIFIVRLYEVMVDVAFCQRNKHWFTLRIIREITIHLKHYNYETVGRWAQYAEHLPTPFLTKAEADNYLSAHKMDVFKSMILQAARKIHRLFYQITESEIDEIIPESLINKLSIDKLYDIEVLIDGIVKDQAKATLKRKGFATWEAWDAAVQKESLSN